MVALATTDYDLKRQYDFSKVEIVREYAPGLGEVPCVSSQIDLVIFNLLKNAAQAMHEDRDRVKAIPPRIVLRALQDGGMARIEVEDNGPGMDENARRRLFEPGEASGPEAGTGLGLSLSAYIIKDVHRGELWVESAPGEGTRFVIRIPLERREA
jgi:signal transduction histidine kinase